MRSVSRKQCLLLLLLLFVRLCLSERVDGANYLDLHKKDDIGLEDVKVDTPGENKKTLTNNDKEYERSSNDPQKEGQFVRSELYLIFQYFV